MKKTKDVFTLLFLILAAVVVGGMVASLTAGIPALKWLTYGESIGFNFGNTNPLINLSIFKMNFGFEMQVSVLQIILICVSLFVYRKLK